RMVAGTARSMGVEVEA
ncbi:MAG: hypothetical protein ACREJM_14085, partial [Candidatus Saccharimonadales bacterium]